MIGNYSNYKISQFVLYVCFQEAGILSTGYEWPAWEVYTSRQQHVSTVVSFCCMHISVFIQPQYRKELWFQMQSSPVCNQTVIFLISTHILGCHLRWTVTSCCMLSNMCSKKKFLFPEWDVVKYQWMCPVMWAISGTSSRCLLCLERKHHQVTHGTQTSVMMMMISVRSVTWIGSWHWNEP